jgi:hypothetical protein
MTLLRKYICLFLLYLAALPVYSQSYLKKSALSKEQACIREFLVRGNLLPNNNGPDEYFILQNDSLWMFEKNVAMGDTIKIQVHLVNASYPSYNCKSGWVVKKTEYIRRSVYRSNPAFIYRPYFKVFDLFSGDYAAAGDPGKMGFINTYGEWIIPPRYEQLKPHAWGIWVKNDSGTRIIDVPGSGVRSALYDEVSTGAPRIGPNNIRLTAVKKGNKVGMIGKDLNLVVPMIYDDVRILSTQFLLGMRQRRIAVIDPATGKEITPLYDKVRLAGNRRLLEVEETTNGRAEIKTIDPYHSGAAIEVPQEWKPQTPSPCACGNVTGRELLTVRIQGDSLALCKEGSITTPGRNNNKPRNWLTVLGDTSLRISNRSTGDLYDCNAGKRLVPVWRDYYIQSYKGRIRAESVLQYDSLTPDGKWKEGMMDLAVLRETFYARNGRIERTAPEWILRLPVYSSDAMRSIHELLAKNSEPVETNYKLLRKLIVPALGGDAACREALLKDKPRDRIGLLAYYQYLLSVQPKP